MHNPSGEKDRLNLLSNQIIGAALRVHEELGPGLLESAYEACLAFEIVTLGLNVERQKPLPLVYRGHRVDCGYRLDMLVNDSLVVAVKAIEQLARVHTAQLRSHLKLSGKEAGSAHQLQRPSVAGWHQTRRERVSRVKYSLRSLRPLRSPVV